MKNKIVAFTGAGISRASGIPTFAEGGDIRNYLHRSFFEQNPKEFYDRLLELESVVRNAKPNPAHLALAEYGIPVITMNVDGLHQKAGSSVVIEVHGNAEQVHCHRCELHFPFEYTRQSITCPKCGSVLEHDLVLYGDVLPEQEMQRAYQLVTEAEHLLIVGTSFYTSTSSIIPGFAADLGGKATLVNENAEYELPRLLKQLASEGS